MPNQPLLALLEQVREFIRMMDSTEMVALPLEERDRIEYWWENQFKHIEETEEHEIAYLYLLHRPLETSLLLFMEQRACGHLLDLRLDTGGIYWHPCRHSHHYVSGADAYLRNHHELAREMGRLNEFSHLNPFASLRRLIALSLEKELQERRCERYPEVAKAG